MDFVPFVKSFCRNTDSVLFFGDRFSDGFWLRYLLLSTIPIPITHIDHSTDRRDRHCEDDPEDATEGCPDQHDDKYEKRGEVE
jgi:hypothetical protein